MISNGKGSEVPVGKKKRHKPESIDLRLEYKRRTASAAVIPDHNH
jgi:hypothetical protein